MNPIILKKQNELHILSDIEEIMMKNISAVADYETIDGYTGSGVIYGHVRPDDFHFWLSTENGQCGIDANNLKTISIVEQ